jgi:HK97 family phage portal protein
MRSPIGALLSRKQDVNTPVPFASRAQSYARGLFGSSRGMTAQLDTMGSASTLFAIVNRTAKAEAGVEWGLYRKAKSGKKEDRVEVTAHAALDLWNKPNDFFTQSVFVEAGAQHKQLTGETWWVVAKDDRFDLPLEMWVVRPDRIRPVPDPEKFLTGYMYMGPDGQEVALRKEDVIFTRTPHPTDPYRGIGPVQALLTDLDAARYSAEWNRNFFLNSAEPGGIIEVPSVLSDPEFDQLQARWNEQHKGVANAHRVAILEHGKWIDRKFTQRDMQFMELRNLSREVIREAFGFPKPMTGAVDDVNRANGDSGERMFARWLCVPDLEAMRDALNWQLLPMYGRMGEGLEFDFKNPVPDDVESETKQLTARSDAAAVLVRAGFQPKGTLTAVGLPDIPFVGVPAAPGARPAVEPAALWRKAVAGLTGGSAMRRKVVAAADDDDDDPVRRQFETALESLLAEWTRVEGGWIEALADAVEAAVDDDDAGALGELSVDTTAGVSVLEEALAGMARVAADRMVAEAAEQGVEVDAPELGVSNRVSVAGIRAAYGSELAAVAVATAALLGSELARSAAVEALRLFTPGAVGRQVADGVKSFLRGLKGRFKKDQLGGALHRAQNTGRIAVLEEAPLARYFASEKSDACDPCKDVDGTEFDDLDAVRAAYGTGGYQLCEGGIRCRGTVIATWE